MYEMTELLKTLDRIKKEKTECLLNEFFESRIDDALEATLKENNRYQEASREICEKIVTIEQIKLSKEQWRVVDSALSASSNKGAEYGRVAYYQGFKDAVNLLCEIGHFLY